MLRPYRDVYNHYWIQYRTYDLTCQLEFGLNFASL
jgi:hypothetical protein